MSLSAINFINFVGNIDVYKKSIFGDIVVLSIIVTPSLKIITIDGKEKKNFPFKKGDFIEVNKFIEWSKSFNFKIKFSTKNSKLKRDLYFYFDTLIIKDKKTKKKYSNRNFKKDKIFH